MAYRLTYGMLLTAPASPLVKKIRWRENLTRVIGEHCVQSSRVSHAILFFFVIVVPREGFLPRLYFFGKIMFYVRVPVELLGTRLPVSARGGGNRQKVWPK